jgi:hypothetical protein
MSEAMTPDPKPTHINIETHDMTEIRVIIMAMVKALNAGPKSRARSLVVTKLEEASMWAEESLIRD